MNIIPPSRSEFWSSRCRQDLGFRVPGFGKEDISGYDKKSQSITLKHFRNARPFPLRCLFLTLVLCILSGCGNSESNRYYQLSSLPNTENLGHAGEKKKGTIIGIGPVEIPRYVDRLQLVTRTSDNVVELAEFDRWAEPVDTDVKRVLIENVSQLLGKEKAAVIKWDEGLPLDYQVRIEVTRFDFENTGVAVLTARWNIIGKDERKPLLLKTSRFTQSAPPDDFALMVGAMSRNLESLSQEIVSALSPLL